jgi:predicted transcriptional regulator
LELEVMRVFWSHTGPITIRKVERAINAIRPFDDQLAYTTVMTTVHRLAEPSKAMLTELEERMHGRASLFVPAIDRVTFLTSIFQQVVRELGATSSDCELAHTAVITSISTTEKAR